MIPVNYNSQHSSQLLQPITSEKDLLQNQHSSSDLSPLPASNVYSLGEIVEDNRGFNRVEKLKPVREQPSERLESSIVIDTSGRNGANAGPINVRLSTSGSFIKIDTQEGSNTRPLRLVGSIDLIAEGEPGRDGFDGETGRSGTNGTDGTNASPWRGQHGRNGTNGTDAGHGRPGWPGCNGSNGGTIKVTAVEEDKDLFMLINKVSIQRGRAGRGGRGGHGGVGGKDGIAGTSYTSMTEVWGSSPTEYRTFYGGRAGRGGAPGKDGKDGKDGRSGLDGTFHFFVEDENGETHSYDRRYDLKTTFLGVDAGVDGICEPGKEISVRMNFQNIGGMSTPSEQAIAISLKSSLWIRGLESKRLPCKMQVGDSHDTVLKFCISDYDDIAVERPFSVKPVINPIATMSRVNKTFKGVNKSSKVLWVRYPVELSGPIRGVSLISANEEAPIAFVITNISKVNLGSNSKHHRVVQCKIYPKNPDQQNLVRIRDREGNISKEEPWLKDWDFDLLKKGPTPFSVTVSFVDKITPLYTKVEFVARLDIGTLNDPMGEEVVTLQERSFTIQLSESFVYNPSAQFLIVTNNNTHLQELQAWRTTLKQLFDSNVMVWNTSLYNGFSLEHQKKDTTRLIDQLRGKTLIILNYQYKNNDQQIQTISSQIPHGELFRAAKEAGIRTLLVGGPERLTNNSQPQLDIPGTEHKSSAAFLKALKNSEISKGTFPARFHIFSNEATSTNLPKEYKLTTKAEDLAKTLFQKYPWKQFHIYYKYSPEKLGKSHFFRQRWKIGTITVAEGLTSLVKINLPNPQSPQTIASDNNLYAISRTVEFAQRLKRYPDIKTDSQRKIIADSILSDICDEFHALTQQRWNSLNSTAFQKGLPKLKELANVLQSSDIFENEIYQELYCIFLYARMIVGKICSRADVTFPLNSRRAALKSAVKSIYKELQVYNKEHGITIDNEWKGGEKKRIKKFLAAIKRDKVLNRFRCSYGNIECNNQNIKPHLIKISDVKSPQQVPLHIRNAGNAFATKAERSAALKALECSL